MVLNGCDIDILLEFDPECNSYGNLVMSMYLFDEMKKSLSYYMDKISELNVIKSGKSMNLSVLKGFYVYFLFKGESIVYIGQTVNLPNRIGEHIKTKDFDSVYYESVVGSEMSIIESLYITLYGGHYNIVKYSDYSLIINKIIDKIDLFEY